MKVLDQVSMQQLRAFEAAYRNKSMTEAAQTLHLTQPGISQHIKALETTLGVRLFDRLQRKLVPTPSGHALFESCVRNLGDLSERLDSIRGIHDRPSGMVIIGMPLEFGKHLILPELVNLSKMYPEMSFRLKIGLGKTMNDLLLDGEADLAFVDDFPMDRRIQLEKVYDEILEMCILSRALAKRPTARKQKVFFESLPYVAYLEGEPVLRMWFHHHLRSSSLRLSVKAYAVHAEMVASFVTAGLGASVLPRHLLEKLQEAGHKLYVFEGSGRPLINRVSVAIVRGRDHSPATLAVLAHLKQSLKQKRS